MSALEFAGALSMGALAVILLAFGFVAYLARGHRIDLSGFAVKREWWPSQEPRLDYVFRGGDYAPPAVAWNPAVSVNDRGAYDGARAAGLAHTEATRVATMQHGAKTTEVDDD